MCSSPSSSTITDGISKYWTPFLLALPFTHEFGFVPSSRTAHCTGTEAQPLLVLVHIHLQNVQLARLILLCVCPLFSHHCVPLSANRQHSSQNIGPLQKLPGSKPTPITPEHRCSVAPASPASPSELWVPDTLLPSVLTGVRCQKTSAPPASLSLLFTSSTPRQPRKAHSLHPRSFPPRPGPP